MPSDRALKAVQKFSRQMRCGMAFQVEGKTNAARQNCTRRFRGWGEDHASERGAGVSGGLRSTGEGQAWMAGLCKAGS